MGQLNAIAIKRSTRAPMELLESAHIDARTGLSEDFRGTVRKRQVSVLASEAWSEACAELQVDLPWTLRRANLLVAGVELPKTPGALLIIGAVTLRVEVETKPCSRMDEQHEGLTAALKPDWRGGVCCTVATAGEVNVGDSVIVEESPADEVGSHEIERTNDR
ncbi:MAG: MOSC domain-containing protein [Pseudomonadota bacterium]